MFISFLRYLLPRYKEQSCLGWGALDLLEEVSPRLKTGPARVALQGRCQELHMPKLKKGRTQAKVFDLLKIYFVMNTELQRGKKNHKKITNHNRKEIQGKIQGWKREWWRYQNLLLEWRLSPARTTKKKEKTKAVGFLNGSVFTSSTKEPILQGLEEVRKHFRALMLQDTEGHTSYILRKLSWEALEDQR